MKGRADFIGDTLLFKADTTGSACQTADARYVVSRTEDELHIAGVGHGQLRRPARGAGRDLEEVLTQTAGHCCVTQWKAPRPQTRSVQSMPTMSRSGKSRLQRRRGLLVARRVVGRQQHEPVGDVEVGVAGRQPLALVLQGPRHRQRDDPERPTVLVGHPAEPLQVGLERLVVFVRRIGLDGGHHGPLVHEPGQIVHVAVGVVARDPVAQPEDLGDAEIVAQVALDRRRGRAAGLRLGLSRQASVVSSVPRPLTSIEPPSMTMPGWKTGRPSSAPIRVGITSSRS